jgi:hypothetical protein
MAAPAALIAIAAIQAGMTMMQQREQRKAARKARAEAERTALTNQNKLVEEGFARRQQQAGAKRGTVLGGPAGTEDPQATVLSQQNQKRSIVGG